MEEEKRVWSEVTRSWGTSLFMGVFGLALCVWAFLLVKEENNVVAVIAGAIGGVALIGSFLGSGRAPCPHCGHELFQLMALTLERCSDCLRYVEVKNGRVWEIDSNWVTPNPEFAIPLPDTWQTPAICCVCGEPATRNEEVSLKLLHVQDPNLSLTGDLMRHSLLAPHCEKHSGGAKLDREVPKEDLSLDSMAETTGPLLPVTVLKVRSYRFYLEFLELNDIS